MCLQLKTSEQPASIAKRQVPSGGPSARFVMVIDRDSDVWGVETENNLGTDMFEVNYLLRDKRHDLVN